MRELGAMVYAPRQAQAFGLIDEVADLTRRWRRWQKRRGWARTFAAVQRSGLVYRLAGWLPGLAGGGSPDGARGPDAASIAGRSQTSKGVAVCQRTEPLVLSDFYARQYPGC